MTKNDVAWESLFNDHGILDAIRQNGKFTISAREINIYREARLMTKFDHTSNLPTLFQDNQLSILPVSRGGYVIAKFDAYMKFGNPSGADIKHLTFPEGIQSIDFENITSEAIAINCAYVSGMLSDFLEEETLFPTVSGRMSSGEFDFNINSLGNNSPISLAITNSQIEIDGGYEGANSLSLIEAKNTISTDFLVRQLYYPFRLWRSKVQKQVRPVFLVYSNGIFKFYEYAYEDHQNYNSLTLLKQKNYSLESKDISLDDIQGILSSVTLINEPELPFPQADSFERLVNLCEFLFQREQLSEEDITTTYDFDKRQTSYYTNAGRYLGIIGKVDNGDGIEYCLTTEGKDLFTLNYKNRQLKLIGLILEHSVFAQSLTLYLSAAEPPTNDQIVNLMKQSNLYNITTNSTFSRRASTVSGWTDWILNRLNKF